MEIKTVTIAVYVVSFALAIRVVMSHRQTWEKTLLILVLAIPIIGPVFYLVISGLSRRLIPEQDGHGGGLGRKFLDQELADSADTPVYWDAHLRYLKEELSKMGNNDEPDKRKLRKSKKKNK